MYHKPGWFVDYKHMAVFIDYVEGYILGDYLEFIARTVHDNLNHIERLDTVIAFHRFAVDKYAAGFSGLLHAVARRFLQPGDQKFVYPQQFLSFVGHEAEMLV